jgi:HK97 family phage prohead protease
MPYFISDETEDCTFWAVVKEDGEIIACHDTKQSAVDQMVALSLAEEIDPGGTYTGPQRAAPDDLEVGDFVSWNSAGGRARGRITEIVRDGEINVPDSDFTITGEPDDPAALIRLYREGEDGWEAQDQQVGHKFSTLTKINDLRSYTREALGDDKYTTEQEALDKAEEIGCSGTHSMDEDGQTIYMPCSTHDEYEELTGMERGSYSSEKRDVNLDPPAYMRAAARQGLRYYEEGLAGDGLVERTVREARAMANGNVTADKWVRLRAWVARHMDDLDSPSANPDSDDYPSAGVVAHLLWGSGPSKRAAQRALDYADGVVSRLEEENSLRIVSGEAMSKLETRYSVRDIEVREEKDGMRFTGYAAVFDSPSEPLPFTEMIERGAFKRSIESRNDIKLLWNHDTASVLGSTRAKTLRLYEDERGLKVEAMLPNTTLGRDAAELLRRGDVDSMSFGFSVPRGGDEWSDDGMLRTLKSVRLHEISIVAFPAYSGTAGTTSVRGLAAIAQRAEVDPDLLADTMLKIEEGKSLTEDEAGVMNKVLGELSPQEEVEQKKEELDGMLELHKKKLQYLIDRI